MRIRKCLGKKPLGNRSPPRRRAVQATRRDDEPALARTAPDGFTDEVHPNSKLREGLKGFKYTTGLLNRRSRDHCITALKVYSELPITYRKWQRLFKAAAIEKNVSKDDSAYAVLDRILSVALKAHASDHSVRDVHYQIFDRRNETAARLTRRDRLNVSKWVWNLILSVHRSSVASAALARPRFHLATGPFDFDTKCTIASNKGSWQPQVRLTIAAHLKNGFLAAYRRSAIADQPQAEPWPTLDQMVADLITQAATCARDGVYGEANDLLLQIKESLVQWLPTSPFAMCVDLHELEIIISHEDLGRRYVANTMLNASGSERLVSLAQRPNTMMGMDVETQSSYGSYTKNPILSVAFAEPRIEASSHESSRLTADLRYHCGDGSYELDPMPDRLLQQFRGVRSGAVQPGFLDSVLASIALTGEHRRVFGSIHERYFIGEGLTALGYPLNSSALLTYNLNQPEKDGDIKVTLPVFQVMRAKSSTDLDPPRIQVNLHAQYHPSSSDDLPHVGKSGASRDEFVRLAKMNTIVLQRIWEEIALDTYQAAALTIAEAISRIIQFESPGLVLCRVNVQLISPETNALIRDYRANVFTRTVEDDYIVTAHRQPTLRSPKNPEIVEADRPVSLPVSDIRVVSSGALALSCRSEPSRVLEDSLGLPDFAFSIKWGSVHAGSVPAMSVQSVRRKVENVISAASGQGLQCARLAWKTLAQLDPPPTRVSLTIRGLLSGTDIHQPSTSATGVLELELKDHSQFESPNIVITLSSVFEKTFDATSPSISFDVLVKGVLLQSEGTMTAARFADFVISNVRSAVCDKHFQDLGACLHTVADSLHEQDGKLASVLHLKDVALQWSIPGVGAQLRWASRVRLGAVERSGDKPVEVPRHSGLGTQEEWDQDRAVRDGEEESSGEIRKGPDSFDCLQAIVATVENDGTRLWDGFRAFARSPRSSEISEFDLMTLWRTDRTTSTADISVHTARGAVEEAFQEHNLGPLFGAYRGWQRLVSMHPKMLNTRTVFRGWPAAHIGHLQTKDKAAYSLIVAIQGSPSEAVPIISVSLPVFDDLSYPIDELTSTGIHHHSLRLALQGRPVSGDELNPGTWLSKELRETTETLFGEQRFATVDSMLSALCARILDQRARFHHIIDLTKVRARWMEKDEDQETVLRTKTGAESVAKYGGPAEEVKGKRLAKERPDEVSAGPELPVDVPPTLIALGSNVGDRLSCIEEACRALDADPDIRVVKTSSLYETKAMYVEDQAPFLNGVCEIETSLKPIELLDRTQAIENQLGRVKTLEKGPRNIDLDILLHGNTVMETERLTIPHPLMLERHFVLRPMDDVVQMANLKHPRTQRTFESHVKQLGPPDEAMQTLTPLGPDCRPLRPLDPTQPTSVMSILNVTPDSFSDGGDNVADDLDSLKDLVRSHIASGATIVDVGGQSSRPNAPDVSAEEEIRRILPAIEAIRSLPEAAGVAISVDTYRASVADAAIGAGAHIINDISAGQLDPGMLTTIARLGCTYVMMHIRGTPATMMDEENCRYPHGIMGTVAWELRERVEAAQAAGIRRWRIILDPGIGFSKTVEQNVRLLRDMRRSLVSGTKALKRMPWLLGTSRKSFIGKITGVEDPKDRTWGTAATVTAAVRGGASIVRVHDVAEMAKVVKMADAIYQW